MEKYSPLKAVGTRKPASLKWFAALTGAFCVPLLDLVRHSLAHNLHSHIVVVPFISAYLAYDRRSTLIGRRVPWLGGAVFFTGAALALLALFLFNRATLSHNDCLAVVTGSYLLFLSAFASIFLGKSWMISLSFPIVFLIFMIPLPDAVVSFLETWLVRGTAEVTNMLFFVSGTPFSRVDQTKFEFSEFVIAVARECSGIRSTWVLFITSLLCAYLFLRTPGRRTLLVGVVLPIGLLRNGCRIVLLTLLSIHVNPEVIRGPLHHRGGPYFFALSLIPFVLLLWWLRRTESRRAGTNPTVGATAEPVPSVFDGR